MDKIIKKQLRDTAKESFKNYKNVFKDYNFKDYKEFIENSYLDLYNDYENVAWDAGYISALKWVLDLLKKL